MILSNAFTPGLHKCRMFKPSRSTRQVHELNLRKWKVKRKTSIALKFSFLMRVSNALKCVDPTACFGFFYFTSLFCTTCRHRNLRSSKQKYLKSVPSMVTESVQWSLCTSHVFPQRHFRFKVKVKIKPKKILSKATQMLNRCFYQEINQVPCCNEAI